MSRQKKKISLKEINIILKNAERIETIILLGTKAYSCLGDASRKHPSLCLVCGSTADYYVGCWHGSQLLDVVFPKETTRRIVSVADIEKYLNPYHIDTSDLGYLP